MNQIRPGSGAPAAVLAGSLAVFPLLEVLGLLGRTHHAGELHVVADGVEAHLWVEGGDLLDHAATAADRLFELACLEDAWFTVSSALPRARSEQRERVSLQPLLEQVAPHVLEWQSLMKALPFGAVARMAPAMPGPEAQIRSDQWRILSLIGTGRPVHEVIDVSDARPLETLRLVHELAQRELIAVEVPPAGGRRRTQGREATAGAGGPDAPPAADAPGQEEGEGSARAPDETRVHAPDAARVDEVDDAQADARAGGAVGDADAPEEPGERPSVAAARPVATALTTKRPGAVRAVLPEDPPAPTVHGGAPPRRPGHHAVAAYMPPPVTPSFWPLPDAATTDAAGTGAVGAAAHQSQPEPPT